MRKADLHIHSTVSDGSASISEIIALAKSRNLDAIAITDHDTMSQRNQIPAHDGIQVLCGAELSAFDYKSNTRAHVLGYRIAKPEIIDEAGSRTLKARHENSLRQIEVLNEHGFHIDADRVDRADGKYIYKQHIMDYLLKRGDVDALFGDFYYRTFKNGGICQFDIRYMDVREAVDVIKEAGGIPVLAHSGQQQNFFLIPELVALGLKGLEVNHHSHSELDREKIHAFADEYGLFLTGGSDFHGRYEPQIFSVGDFLAEESGFRAVVE